MKCAEVGRLLTAYVDGELEPQSAPVVQAHVDGCPKCRAALAAAQAVRAAIARACEPVKAPATLRKKVRAQLAGNSGPRQTRISGPWRVRLPWLVAAPGIAALVVVGLLMLAQPWNGRSDASTVQAMRVVYHIASSDNVGANLRTLKNHLDAMPGLRVVVVAHNDGIRFLLQGAKDTEGQPYVPVLRELRGRGVEFRICANTLTRRQIDTRAVVSEAVLVPSGIAEISRLQAREGYLYLRL